MKGQELFKKWLLELRNPENIQGVGHLYGENGVNCALGVCGRVYAATENASLPSYIGINDALFPIPSDGTFVLGLPVARLNDTDGLTFPEIADELESAYLSWLEAQPKEEPILT